MSGVVEASLQAPAHTTGVGFIDGSQFSPAIETVLKQIFTTPSGFQALQPGNDGLFPPEQLPHDVAALYVIGDRPSRSGTADIVCQVRCPALQQYRWSG